MYLNSINEIVRAADSVVQQAGSRDPHRIAADLGIFVVECPFKTQKGVYKVILRDRYIFLKEDLDPVMKNIVLLHEIGHDQLHRSQACQFQEFNLFDMSTSQMEYEANLFAAQIALPDDEIIDLVYQGYNDSQIAGILHSDTNLVALKVSMLSRQGYPFRVPEHRDNFL